MDFEYDPSMVAGTVFQVNNILYTEDQMLEVLGLDTQAAVACIYLAAASANQDTQQTDESSNQNGQTNPDLDEKCWIFSLQANGSQLLVLTLQEAKLSAVTS